MRIECSGETVCKISIAGKARGARGTLEEIIRELVRKIKKDTHGIYVAKRFSMEEPTNVPEIINKLNLNPGVLRFIISDATELPELKTKEERIEQEEKRGEVEKMRQDRKEAEELEKNPPEKEESAPVAPKTEAEEIQAAQDSEAIDKKLEEILNI